ncbi:hypothetical protein ACF1GR_08345 [Streptomyces albidoflavus]
MLRLQPLHQVQQVADVESVLLVPDHQLADGGVDLGPVHGLEGACGRRQRVAEGVRPRAASAEPAHLDVGPSPAGPDMPAPPFRAPVRQHRHGLRQIGGQLTQGLVRGLPAAPYAVLSLPRPVGQRPRGRRRQFPHPTQ